MATLWLAVEFPDDDASEDAPPLQVAVELVQMINEARFANGCPFDERLSLAETPPPLWRREGEALTVP